MDILEQVKIMTENKFLRSNEEIEKFELSIENILNNEDQSDIKYLYTGFDDSTEDEEVMFGLIHTIESYAKVFGEDIALKEFLNAIPSVYPYAKGWIIIMQMRILNKIKKTNSLESYIGIIQNCDKDLKNILVELMNEIRDEDPKRFSQMVDIILNRII